MKVIGSISSGGSEGGGEGGGGFCLFEGRGGKEA